MTKKLTDSSLQKRLYVLVLIGLVISFILLVHHAEIKFGFQELPSACAINSYVDCDAVARSGYSELAGLIPTASLSVFYFLVWLGLLGVAKRIGPEESRQSVFAWSVLGVIATVTMMMISFFIVKKFCLYCSMLWLCNFIIFFITWRGIRELEISPFLAFGNGGGVITRLFIPFVGKSDSNCSSELLLHGILSALLSVGLLNAIVFWWLPIDVRFKLADLSKSSKIAPAKLTKAMQDLVTAWERSPAQSLPINLGGSEPDYFFGNPSAGITIVEFGDYECPSCRKASGELTQFEKEYSGKVRVIFKNYPLDQACNPAITHSMHKHSCKAAAMARCAGHINSESFWKMHHAIYQLNNVDEQILTELPIKNSLFEKGSTEESNYWSCVSDNRTFERIRQDIDVAQALDIKGTPTVYLNGVLVPQPFNGGLAAIVQNLLR